SPNPGRTPPVRVPSGSRTERRNQTPTGGPRQAPVVGARGRSGRRARPRLSQTVDQLAGSGQAHSRRRFVPPRSAEHVYGAIGQSTNRRSSVSSNSMRSLRHEVLRALPCYWTQSWSNTGIEYCGATSRFWARFDVNTNHLSLPETTQGASSVRVLSMRVHRAREAAGLVVCRAVAWLASWSRVGLQYMW